MTNELNETVAGDTSHACKWVILLTTAVATLQVSARAATGQADMHFATDVGRYHLQSNLWVNLHQRLFYEASFGTPPPVALSGEDLATWKKAVESYRKILGKRSPIVDRELISMDDALAATTTRAVPASIPKALSVELESARPLYEAGQWQVDDRANRFWMAVTEPMLASAAEELIGAHEKAYAVPFPKHILVDVTSFAWEFGSYTVGPADAAHVVISSTVPGNQGFGALEMMMHEPSHVIVEPNSGAIGADLARASAELNIRPPGILWHAILFYTSGELTRRALADRGVFEFQPSMAGMYARGFQGFRKALETHWQMYLDGKVTRDEAIRQILIETAPAKK